MVTKNRTGPGDKCNRYPGGSRVNGDSFGGVRTCSDEGAHGGTMVTIFVAVVTYHDGNKNI